MGRMLKKIKHRIINKSRYGENSEKPGAKMFSFGGNSPLTVKFTELLASL
jgi:hypothetical protein